MTTTLKQMFVHSIVNYTLYILLIAITLYIVKQILEQPIRSGLSQLQYKSRVRSQRLIEDAKDINERSQFFRHLYFLLKATNGKNNESNVISFLFTTGLLFFLSFLVLFFNANDIFLTIILSILIALLPYFYLHVKLKNLRNTVGNELTGIVQSLTQNYNSCQYDMIQTLTKTKNTIQDQRLRLIFVRLINNLQTAKSDQELSISVEEFIYTCGNSWSKRLGNIILKSYMYKENVINALMILTKQMEDTEKMLEEEKSYTQDSVLNGFLTLVMFPASIGLGYYVAGPQDWVKLQFGEHFSLLLFILCTVMTVISVLISLLLRKPKNDI